MLEMCDERIQGFDAVAGSLSHHLAGRLKAPSPVKDFGQHRCEIGATAPVAIWGPHRRTTSPVTQGLQSPALAV